MMAKDAFCIYTILEFFVLYGWYIEKVLTIEFIIFTFLYLSYLAGYIRYEVFDG